jgi:thioredoxin-like negative regulator of GroEL
MSGLLFLQSGDFNIQTGNRGDILCNSIRGISLILFYSTKCGHCQNLIPVFKRLPGSIGGCQFGMINVSLEKDIIRMAKNTIVPIEFVPLIILFVNGKPYVRYDGSYNDNELRLFIVNVTKQLQTKDKFSQDRAKQTGGEREIPLYSVGIPLCGDDEVYLEFEEAYGS